MDVINNKISKNDYENKILKLSNEAKSIQHNAEIGKYKTQESYNKAKNRLNQINKQISDLEANWQDDINDYNDLLL